MKRKLIPCLILAAAGILLFSLWGAGILAQIKGPADFQFKQGKGSLGVVTFSHEFHDKKELKCVACHDKIFKMKKFEAKVDMASLNAGKACGSCHNGKVAFATNAPKDCARCHKKT